MQKFHILLCSSLFLFSPILFAEDCDPGETQFEMNQCAFKDFEQADKKLNQVWKQLLSKEKANIAYLKQLRAAQRAWITFRDAEVAAIFACEEENPRYCWGSMYPMLYHGEMRELTQQRTKRLQQYLQHGQNPAIGE